MARRYAAILAADVTGFRARPANDDKAPGSKGHFFAPALSRRCVVGWTLIAALVSGVALVLVLIVMKVWR